MTEPVIQVCYSDDGGRNWSSWREVGIGEVGEYNKRVRVRRLGSCRRRVWKIRTSAACTVQVLGAVAVQEAASGG